MRITEKSTAFVLAQFWLSAAHVHAVNMRRARRCRDYATTCPRRYADYIHCMDTAAQYIQAAGLGAPIVDAPAVDMAVWDW